MASKTGAAISDEMIIAAIMQHTTIKAAAASLNMAERTIYDRMKKQSFRAAYEFAKADIMRTATREINDKLSEAVRTVSDIMTDASINPAIRLQAAQIIIKNADRFTNRAEIMEHSAISSGHLASYF